MFVAGWFGTTRKYHGPCVVGALVVPSVKCSSQFLSTVLSLDALFSEVLLLEFNTL
jgi:hypothetical protein